MAELTSEQYDMTTIEDKGDMKSVYEAQEEELDELRKESDNIPSDVVVGRLIRFQVADGYAYYRVVDEDPLRIQHVPYGDRYAIPAAHVRGLRREDIFRHTV